MSVKVSSPLRVVYMKFPMSMNIIRRRLKDFLASSSDDVECAVSYDDVYGCGWVLPGHHVRYIQAFDKVVDKSLYRDDDCGSLFLVNPDFHTVLYMKFPMSMNIIRRRLKDFLASSSDDVECAVSYDDVYGCGWVLPGHHVRYIQAFDKVVDKSLYRDDDCGSLFLVNPDFHTVLY